MSPSPATATPIGNLTYLLTQGLTVAHLAQALGTTDETIRAVITDRETPMDDQTRDVLATLTARTVADANSLVSREDFTEHLDRLTLDGCQAADIARTLSLPAARLRLHLPQWIDTTRDVGRAWSLTIEQIDDPQVKADLTWGRLESLETMGWSRDDVEATIGPGLPTGPKGLIPRAVAQAVVAYWQTYSGRLNPVGVGLARQRREQGVRTPADWDPPASALWWPPFEHRHLLGKEADFTCGPTPRRH